MFFERKAYGEETIEGAGGQVGFCLTCPRGLAAPGLLKGVRMTPEEWFDSCPHGEADRHDCPDCVAVDAIDAMTPRERQAFHVRSFGTSDGFTDEWAKSMFSYLLN